MNSNPPQPHQFGNISYAVTISLTEAATGKTESLIVAREDACEICSGTGQSWRDDGTCTHCNNTGYARYEKRFELRIPAGIENGARMRISGEGNLAAAQAVRGDLYVVVNVSPHELFERQGKDLHTFFRLTEDEMKVGGEIVVPTLLDGRKQLRIAPGTDPGTVFRLAGLGLRALEDEARGDLFIRVGYEPVKKNGGDGQKPSVVTPPPTTPPPSIREKSAVKEFVRNYWKGLAFPAALLLCAGLIFLSSRSAPSTSNNANNSSLPRVKPTAAQPVILYDPPPTPALTPPRPPFSLPNGANITPPKGPRGNGYMEIINRGDSDMALKVVSSSSQKTRRFVFVRSGGTVFIRNLPREVYLLRWETGSDWDVETRRFLYMRAFQQFDQTFDLRKTNYRVGFTPSLKGTLNEEPLDESEFEDK